MWYKEIRSRVIFEFQCINVFVPLVQTCPKMSHRAHNVVCIDNLLNPCSAGFAIKLLQMDIIAGRVVPSLRLV